MIYAIGSLLIGLSFVWLVVGGFLFGPTIMSLMGGGTWLEAAVKLSAISSLWFTPSVTMATVGLALSWHASDARRDDAKFSAQ